jgi:protein TonB
MTTASAEFRTSNLRWGLSAALVIAAHLASALGLASMPSDPSPPSPPPAVLLELAPLPVAPLPAESRPPPQPPPPLRPPPMREAVKPPVAIPKPPPKPRVRRPKPPPPKHVEKPKPREEKPTKTVAAAVARTPKAPVKAPPTQSTVAARPSNALPTFEQKLLAHLERYKRYPLQSRRRHESGVVYLRFAMDRNGAVLRAAIARSSGHAALDEEVLSLIRRAEPMPKPPPDVAGATLELIVPVRFSMR